MPRYRFDDFVLSPARRLLLRGDREQPLIPRYFDLLQLLIERRHEAVHRRDIFDRVWGDVVVSDSALTQAIRTIRRALSDDPREPRFIRTVSKHGYRFVFVDVVEEPDEHAATPEAPPPVRDVAVVVGPQEPLAGPEPETAVDAFAPLLDRITVPARTEQDEEDQREAAELLHGLGTTTALERLGARDGHTHARALLRDTRWNVPGAGAVPFAGQPGGMAAAAALISIRLRPAARIVAGRWALASAGGAVAGVAGGAIGGLLLAAAPGSAAPLAVAPVLAGLGGVLGAVGGAGVGAGLTLAEASARSMRTLAIAVCAAAGGGLAGLIVQFLGRWTLETLVGMSLDIGGGVEGIAIGAGAGLAYALTTRRSSGGIAAPRGRARRRTVAAAALGCGLAALAVTVSGRPLVGGTIHRIADQAQGAKVSLQPLGRLVGEPDFGPLSRALLGTGEGAIFGIGLALGLTRRRAQ